MRRRPRTPCGRFSEGFTAVKMGPVGPTDIVDGADVIRGAVKRVAAVREAVGRRR
jgi:L-alanine-DL-glutamate epimerase-like enolase superfamily enzyme